MEQNMTTQLKTIPVESTMIESIVYNTQENVLVIDFKNGTKYTYENVPLNEVENLETAQSKGKYLNENIKGKYTFTKTQ